MEEIKENDAKIEEPGGIVRRGFGNIIDVLLIIALTTLLGTLFGSKDSLAFDLLEFLYYILTPVLWVGYTVGKKLVGVQINRVDGNKVSIWTMLKRHLIATIALASPILIGALLLIITTDIPFSILIESGTLTEEERNVLTTNDSTIITYATIGGIGTIVLNLVNIFMVGLRKDHRGIHDFIAGTYVKITKA
ncbi:RDD family protein [Alkalihalobacillus sp. R86527]|uniref:RDD family protein n=1 Tax=Alkalihalobacillus sp. R86527 TaxID=3093863 RepID=UPI003671A36D